MNVRHRPVTTRDVLCGLVAAFVALVVSASGVTPSGAAVHAGSQSDGFATPLATSVATSQGTWAAVPMGKSGHFTTFWQVLFRPPGSSSWTDHVKATAVATNGGIVMATSGSSLVVGVLPSYLLKFSPLIATSDAAHTWTNGLLSNGLSPRTDALASSGAAAVALVGHGGSTRVLSSTGDLSVWHPLVTTAQLRATAAGRSCGVGSLTGVALVDGHPVVGAQCEKPGVVGVFVDDGGSWQVAGPPAVTRGDPRARFDVLAIAENGGAFSLLLGVTRSGGSSLEAAWERATPDAATSSASTDWTVSGALPLPAGGRLVSDGVADATDAFVVLGAADGRRTLETVAANNATWSSLGAVPAGTSTGAFGPGSTVQALAVHGSELTVWSHPLPSAGAAGTGWSKVQATHIAIPYGSST